MQIIIDDLCDGKVIGLLNQHLKKMHEYSPPESIHALDENKLKDPAITFWSVRIDGDIAGCAALKELTPHTAELKSMKTSDNFLRCGIGSTILQVILFEAKKRGYQTISLETGTNKAFDPAVRLYENFGFRQCAPFDNYSSDPYSRFYSVTI
ncbi:GNAT family N-acetyltransferase [Vibrio sp. SS-MA-C1-2]|uniref:GNAT family N-acetyltransferase n=1 Tax=Vibrio sp. SS-MA-C1-2 TaxID=2908646 RepID=UPI001F3E0882|nr:GNAT family N-acetyltransferase [Vibrio sp. SS-MA-C1-2]UJF17022.1 GNAT family N-acetyltransferase [Vibrio sp. SS-MA-C1-2]